MLHAVFRILFSLWFECSDEQVGAPLVLRFLQVEMRPIYSSTTHAVTTQKITLEETR